MGGSRFHGFIAVDRGPFGFPGTRRGRSPALPGKVYAVWMVR
jgi:hypothetical protein